MPPIVNDFKNGQGHKDKYLDTSRKCLSQEMLSCITWESPNCNHLEVDQCQCQNQNTSFQKKFKVSLAALKCLLFIEIK